ncbi:hypothetical protein AXW60_12360 [Yersinia ruckeri]|nr:hypothetical protein AXW60_12360 [Yersinia ruckeri]
MLTIRAGQKRKRFINITHTIPYHRCNQIDDIMRRNLYVFKTLAKFVRLLFIAITLMGIIDIAFASS